MPSVSDKQQRFFGMIYGANKKGKKLKGKAGKVQKEISKKDAKDFAKKIVKESFKSDADLIWENYIDAYWGYNNIDYPSNDKYGNIPTSSASYYQKGHCPTAPGQATAYVPSQEEQETIDNVEKNNFKLYPYTFYCIGNGYDSNDKSILIYIAATTNISSEDEYIRKDWIWNKMLKNAKNKNNITTPKETLDAFRFFPIDVSYIKQLSDDLVTHTKNRHGRQEIRFYNENGDDITNNIFGLIKKYNKKHKYDNQQEFNL